MADGSATHHTTNRQPIRIRYRRRNKNNTRFPINRLPFIDRKTQNCWAMVKRYPHLSEQHTTAAVDRMDEKFLG